eukprot:1877645-Pyramimonas_sp.AAC.1
MPPAPRGDAVGARVARSSVRMARGVVTRRSRGARSSAARGRGWPTCGRAFQRAGAPRNLPPVEGSLRPRVAMPPCSPKKSNWSLAGMWHDCLGWAAFRALQGE